MVHRCCISSCKMNVRVAEAKGLSYHCFPLKDPHREKWIQAIQPHVDRPESFKIVQGYTRVCSRHFRIKEYSMDSKKRARLNSNAVPSVFPRKNSPLVVQSPIEAAKSQIVNKTKSTATVVTNSTTPDDQLENTTASVQSIQLKDESGDKNLLVESATSSNDQMILNLLNSVSVEAVCGLIEQTDSAQAQPDEVNSDVSNDDKQDQTKRKRRKWNRTAFARTSKSKQKKGSCTFNGVLDESTLDDSLGDMSLSTFLDLTRSNSLDLESELAVSNRDGSLELNIASATNRGSRSSPSCLPVSDPIQVEDLKLMSIEEQELLQSIQAVSLDCGEADMNLNLKNIHIGSSELESSEGLSSHLLSSRAQKSRLENPILLEDALISSASEMSLQSSKQRKFKVAATTNLQQNALRTPSASEIEKLACDLRSSLLTSSIDLTLDGDELRLPVAEFSSHTPIIDIPDNLLISKAKILDKDVNSRRDDSAKRDQVAAPKQSNKSGSKKGTVPRKKLVGITKKPKNSDKYFGKFSVERFCDSDKDIEYYTGFPTYSHYEAFFNSLESHVEKLKVTDIMHGVADLIRNQQQLETQTSNGSSQSKEESGSTTRDTAEEQKRRPITGRSLTRIDELFMTLVRLKRRLPEKVLGHMFYVSQPTVSRIIRAWTVLLSKLLEPIASACETNTLPDGPKCRQTSSKTNGEHNYFTNKGIYIPDSFRQLFLSDVAVAIISSAHNPRLNSSSATVGNNNAKILVNNNNEEPTIANSNTNTNRNRPSYTDNSTEVSPPHACSCKYPCSCTTTAVSSLADDCRVSFAEPNIVSPCGEVEIDSNDFYHWSLLVNE